MHHHARRAALLGSIGLVIGLFPAAGQQPDSVRTAKIPVAQVGNLQAGREPLDPLMYERIQAEGLNHSEVMELASGLVDRIGARLTGSRSMRQANEWARDQLTRIGCANARLEDWGEFGMGWEQANTWVRMVVPSEQILLAQAAPWSPATHGAELGQAILLDIRSEADLAKYKGELAQKIVLLEETRETKPLDRPLFRRLSPEELQKLEDSPPEKEPDFSEQVKPFISLLEFRHKIAEFLAREHALAVVLPSRDGRDGGGSGGTIFDDLESDMTWVPYRRESANPIPTLVMAIEGYGRIYRLIKSNVNVQLEINVQTHFTGDHEHGFNTIAEIPGSDPKLKNDVVMLGAHLDSWAAATGATDDGAGSVIAMEAMRILNALNVKPRRTIRVALWSGEEEGLSGSYAYVSQHFGWFPLADDVDQKLVPGFYRRRVGPLQVREEQKRVSAYFNLDNGGGRIRGVYLAGNLAAKPVFQEWIDPLRKIGVSTLSAIGMPGSDHDVFNAVGIPAFQFIQDPLDYGSRTHHSNMDVFEELRPGDLAQAATVEALFVYEAAMRDAMLPRKSAK